MSEGDAVVIAIPEGSRVSAPNELDKAQAAQCSRVSFDAPLRDTGEPAEEGGRKRRVLTIGEITAGFPCMAPEVECLGYGPGSLPCFSVMPELPCVLDLELERVVHIARDAFSKGPRVGVRVILVAVAVEDWAECDSCGFPEEFQSFGRGEGYELIDRTVWGYRPDDRAYGGNIRHFAPGQDLALVEITEIPSGLAIEFGRLDKRPCVGASGELVVRVYEVLHDVLRRRG